MFHNKTLSIDKVILKIHKCNSCSKDMVSWKSTNWSVFKKLKWLNKASHNSTFKDWSRATVSENGKTAISYERAEQKFHPWKTLWEHTEMKTLFVVILLIRDSVSFLYNERWDLAGGSQWHMRHQNQLESFIKTYMLGLIFRDSNSEHPRQEPIIIKTCQVNLLAMHWQPMI